jgi:Dolichyl-phosphate-mannose-protein mannosyltransferase
MQVRSDIPVLFFPGKVHVSSAPPSRPFATSRTGISVVAVALLALMAVLAGGAALRESVTFDEVAHIGAGVSYLQKFDLRLNEEHPPLPKMLAALPLVLLGTRADYSNTSWTISEKFFPAYLGQWVFGDWLLTHWNDEAKVLAWARLPMLLLTLALGWIVFVYARQLGGDWAGLLCLAVFVSTPAFLTFGPLVLTDMAVTLFSLLTIWRFADLWQNPTKRNAFLLGMSFAGALLSKFTAGILLFVFLAFSLSTRWLPLPGQPEDKAEARGWRKLRWKLTRRGIFGAAITVYVFYFIFSIRQTTNVLYLLGHGPAWIPLRRLLMPAWLYLRGVGLVMLTSSRPSFILGHAYPHGVWFYYPIVFVLKTPLGFLVLLLLCLGLAVVGRKRLGNTRERAIPEGQEFHWRAIWVCLIVFLAFCMLGRMSISIRHFTVPIVLLILLIAPLPRLLASLHVTSPIIGRIATGLAAICALSCLFTALRTYPFYMPYINALGLGRPAYTLLNDSNVDWNQALPEVKRFAQEHAIEHVKIDEYGVIEVTDVVPNAELWDCQKATAADVGSWVVVSGSCILDGQNCGWLQQFPMQSIAGGSMYAIHLPAQIPAAGSPGGPPLPSEYRFIGGTPFDMQVYFLGAIRDPEKLHQVLAQMQVRFQEARDAAKKKSAAGKDTK